MIMLLLLSVVISLICSVSSAEDVIVQTKQGYVKGFVNDTVDVFLGIPFAQAPLNKLRFMPPIAPLKYKVNPYPATNYSAVCMQPTLQGYQFPYGTYMDEDCLYLNIWRKHDDTNNNTLYPIYFWIHGGGLIGGSGTEMRLVGKYLASHENIIVVTINYRLGLFGCLADEYVLKEKRTTGNYGLQDQRMALEWVKENIKNFGGDPNKITIAGESAGASSVAYHLLMENSFEYYHNAILESSATFGEIFTLKDSLYYSNLIKQHLQCKDLECLQQQSAEDLLMAQSIYPRIGATIDMYEFKAQPLELFQSNKYNRNVQILQGNVLNEGSGWIYNQYTKPIPPSQYRKALEFYFVNATKTQLDEVEKVYPCNFADDCRSILSTCFGDFLLVCPTTIIGQFYPNSFSYIFAHSPSYHNNSQLGVAHSWEIPFVFSTLDIFNNYSQAELELAHDMSHMWISFAKTNTPELPMLDHYPTFNATTNTRVRLDLKISIENSWQQNYCQFWLKMYPQIFKN